MKKYVYFIISFFMVCGLGFSQNSIDEILSQNLLKKYYNPEVVDFLTEEGKDKLPEEQKKQALDQLVTALKEKITVTKDEQINAALGSAVGLLMQVSSDDVVGDAGGDVEGYYAGEWASWVDAAFGLVHAGYQDDATAFFEYGINTIPYSSMKGRCVKGLSLANPDKAYDILMGYADNTDMNIQNAALRMMGYLVIDGKVNDTQKNAMIDKLIENTAGLKGKDTLRAVIHSLDLIKGEKAKAAIEKFKKGLQYDKLVKRDALRSLLLTYGDKSVIPLLAKQVKGGFMKLSGKDDELFAGRLLIRAGDDAGFEWAKRSLTPKKSKVPKFLKVKDTGPDIRSNIVNIIVRYGGDRGKKILSDVIGAYKNDDWLKTWIATGLLEMGDKTHIKLVKESLSNPNWDHTAVRITEALAKFKDYSGIPVLKKLIEERPPHKSAGKKLFGALAGIKDNTKQKENHLINLRIDIAYALGRINQPSGVPLLVTLLSDEKPNVRSSAAFALTNMTIPEALSGIEKAMSIDYGFRNKMSKNPKIHAHLIRMAALRFSNETKLQDIINIGKSSEIISVKFLALVLGAPIE